MGAGRPSLGENVSGTEVGGEVVSANAAVVSLLSVSSARLPCARLELGLEQHQQTCEIERPGQASHFDHGNCVNGKNVLLY